MKLDAPTKQFVYQCFRNWLTVRHKATGQVFTSVEVGDAPVAQIAQFCADIDHSDLLYRLLDGKEPY